MQRETGTFVEIQASSSYTKKEMRKLSQIFRETLVSNNSRFLATDYSQLEFPAYPFPIMIRIDNLSINNSQDVEALFVDYWIDGNPHTASGIMHKQTIAFYQDENGMQVALPPQKKHHEYSKTILLQHKSVKKEAKALAHALRESITHAQGYLKDLYEAHLYPTEQIFATHRLFRHIATMLKEPQRNHSLYGLRSFTHLRSAKIRDNIQVA